MAKMPSIAQTRADEENRKLQAGPSTAPLNLIWSFRITFGEPLEWYRDHAYLDLLLDRVAALPWFSELDVLGVNSAYGEPFAGRADVRDALVCDDRITITLARGGPRAAQWINEADLALVLLVAPGRLEIQMSFAEEALRRHRRAAIDEMLALIFAVYPAWHPHATLNRGSALPLPDTITYRRVRPPRTGSRPTYGLVDVVDPSASAEARAIAQATPPPDIQRLERGGLVVLRWVDDPADRAAFEAACSRHEQWIVQVIETKVADAWNAQGDLNVPVFGIHPKPEPLTVFDESRQAGYLFIDVDDAGGVDEGRWQAAEQAARKKTLPNRRKLKEVAIVAQDRAAALRIANRVRSDGFSRVLYRTDDGELWDPLPPGLWIEPVA